MWEFSFFDCFFFLKEKNLCKIYKINSNSYIIIHKFSLFFILMEKTIKLNYFMIENNLHKVI